jgi:hypothetical protein
MGGVVVLLHVVDPEKLATFGDRAACRARVGMPVEGSTLERAEGTAASADAATGAAQQRPDAESAANLLGTATKKHRHHLYRRQLV